MSGFNEKDIGRAIKELIFSLFANLHTCMPGVIESYDYSKQRATVKPTLRRAFLDGSQINFEPIPDVPVVFPASGSASLIFPLQKGDTVLLIFAERSMENWLPAGGIADTPLNRHHSLGDAIAIPGLFPYTHSGPGANNTDLQLKLANQTIKIKADGSVDLGTAPLFSLLNSSYASQLENSLSLTLGQIAAYINAIAPGTVTPFVAPTGGKTTKVSAE